MSQELTIPEIVQRLYKRNQVFISWLKLIEEGGRISSINACKASNIVTDLREENDMWLDALTKAATNSDSTEGSDE